MKLYLVQHGDALPKTADPERPLSERGRSDVERLGSLLSRRGVEVSRVIHSGKTRARQTAEVLARALGREVTAEAASDLDPLDSPEPLAEMLGGQTEDLLVVGHMPFLGKLVALLIRGRDETSPVAFLPGSLVCLERAGEGTWAIVSMVRPDTLAE